MNFHIKVGHRQIHEAENERSEFALQTPVDTEAAGRGVSLARESEKRGENTKHANFDTEAAGRGVCLASKARNRFVTRNMKFSLTLCYN